MWTSGQDRTECLPDSREGNTGSAGGEGGGGGGEKGMKTRTWKRRKKRRVVNTKIPALDSC